MTDSTEINARAILSLINDALTRFEHPLPPIELSDIVVIRDLPAGFTVAINTGQKFIFTHPQVADAIDALGDEPIYRTRLEDPAPPPPAMLANTTSPGNARVGASTLHPLCPPARANPRRARHFPTSDI